MKIATKRLDDNIPLLTANDQYTPQGTLTLLGMDTEMVLEGDGKPLYPHLCGLEQERKLVYNGPDKAYLDLPLYDWHGDGFAFELCVAPAHCLEYMMERVGNALVQIKASLARKHKIKNVTINPSVMYRVPAKVQESAPDEVKRLGCAPSFNVYGDSGKPSKLGNSIRTTGCHLHITASQVLENETTALALVKWADIIVGSAWNYVSPEDPKKESLRRKFYGRAGECRIRTYPKTSNTFAARGVEYRVLPGTVLSNPIYMTLVFNLYRTALRFAIKHQVPPQELTDISKEAVNLCDKDLSEAVLNWLPFKPASKKLLKFIKDNPLPTLTPEEWYNNSRSHAGRGHRWLAHNKRIATSQHYNEVEEEEEDDF